MECVVAAQGSKWSEIRNFFDPCAVYVAVHHLPSQTVRAFGPGSTGEEVSFPECANCDQKAKYKCLGLADSRKRPQLTLQQLSVWYQETSENQKH